MILLYIWVWVNNLPEADKDIKNKQKGKGSKHLGTAFLDQASTGL